jgi:hypothetical protein
LIEDIIYKYSIFGVLVVDRRLENKKYIKAFIDIYSIYRVVILVYNSKVNSMIKKGYRLIINALAKMLEGRDKD